MPIVLLMYSWVV